MLMRKNNKIHWNSFMKGHIDLGVNLFYEFEIICAI